MLFHCNYGVRPVEETWIDFDTVSTCTYFSFY